jgi:hypothetical protein
MMVMRLHWALYVACCVTVVAAARGQRPQSRSLDAVETVKRYVALRSLGAPWADFSPLIAWKDEPGWDHYWLVNRYTVGTAEKKGNTVMVPVTYHRLGLYSHDFIFERADRDVTVRFEVVQTPTGWVIKAPEPDPPDLSVDTQIEALRTAAGNQYEEAERRKQAEAMAQKLSDLTQTKK